MQSQFLYTFNKISIYKSHIFDPYNDTQFNKVQFEIKFHLDKTDDKDKIEDFFKNVDNEFSHTGVNLSLMVTQKESFVRCGDQLNEELERNKKKTYTSFYNKYKFTIKLNVEHDTLKYKIKSKKYTEDDFKRALRNDKKAVIVDAIVNIYYLKKYDKLTAKILGITFFDILDNAATFNKAAFNIPDSTIEQLLESGSQGGMKVETQMVVDSHSQPSLGQDYLTSETIRELRTEKAEKDRELQELQELHNSLVGEIPF